MRGFKLSRLEHAMAYCCTVAALLFLPAYGFTQSESVPAESVPSNATPLPNETISVAINVDFSNLQAPNNSLGSYNATLRWDPVVLQFVSITPAPPPWNAPFVNSDSAAFGKLIWQAFQTGQSTGKINLLSVNFKVVGVPGAMDTLKLSFAELFTTTFRDIRNQLIIQNGTITVRSPNRAPVLAAIANKIMNEGDTLDVALSATDPDGGSITLAARNLPSFGNFTDNGNRTGRIRFTPGFFAAGVYPNIQVIATDDATPALSDTVLFTLTVNNVNRAPQIRPPDAITLNEGETREFTLSAEDPDGDRIALRMINLPAFGSFVDNGDGTGKLRLAPGRDDAGLYPQIALVATDNGTPNLSDTKQLDLTVVDVFSSLVCKTEIASPADGAVTFGDSVEVCVVTQVSGTVGNVNKVCIVNGIPLAGSCVKVPVIDGFNTIVAICTFTDSLSSCLSADTIHVEARFVDPLRCSLSLAPPSGIIICGDSVEVAGTLTITGGVPPYTKTCDVNGVPARNTATGFILKLPVAPGNNTFIATCKVTDAANRVAVCADTIKVVRPAPLACELEIISPADGALINSNTIKVTAITSITGGAPPFTKTCNVNGVAATVTGDTITATVPLAPGRNTLIATCNVTDSCGKAFVCRDTIRVELPATLMCSLILTPSDGAIICGDSVEIKGTLTITGGTAPYTKTCDVNGVPARDTATGFILTLPVAPGSNIFVATCKVTDAVNRVAVCIDTIQVIRPAPLACQLGIIAPADSALISGNTVKVTAVTSITGGVPPFTKTCNVNGVAATVIGDTLVATVPLIAGWNNLIATCTVTDSCGKAVVCRDTIRVEARIIDTLRCSLTLAPPSGTIICGDSVNVVGTLTIAGGVPPYTKTCDVNGVPARDTAAGFVLTLPMAPGNNTFLATCKVTDAANRVTVCIDSIIVIRPAPLVSQVDITAPADNVLICDKSVNVAAVTRITGGVPPFTATCNVNGVAATVTGNTLTATVSLAPGSNFLIATCSVTDSCGNTAVSRDTIRVTSIDDEIAPTSTFTPGYKSVTGTVFDNESGIAKIEAIFLFNAKLTVDPFTPGAKAVNFRVDDLGLEPYLGFDIKITDLCGNSHICDPVLSNLSVDADRRYTFNFRSVDRYLILENHGLTEIQVDLNGHLFNLATAGNSNVRNRNTYVIPEEGSITIDLKPYLLESENVMRLEIEGRAGTGADFTLIDETHIIDHTLALQPIPMTFELSQNYPNPFNPSTTIRFGVPAHVGESAAVQVRIYNTLGELVRTLVNEKMFPGQYAVEWDGRNDRGETVATGIYIYQLVTGGFKQTKKMSFVK